VGLPLVQVVRHRPGEVGALPDGGAPPPPDQRPAPSGERDFTARQAMRTRAFWLISGGHGWRCSPYLRSWCIWYLHLTEGLGYSLAAAGGVVALMTVFQMVGQLSGGYLGDLLSKRSSLPAACSPTPPGCCWSRLPPPGGWCWRLPSLHGIAWGARAPLMVAMRADYFGPTSFGTIMGFSTLIAMLGMSGGPIIAGYLADVSGDYRSGLAVLAGLALCWGPWLFLAARRRQRPGPLRR
jgi:MFS family permease